MYVHSYQAYIWNRMISDRLKSAGTTLTPGDLVMPKAKGMYLISPDYFYFKLWQFEKDGHCYTFMVQLRQSCKFCF